MQPPDKEGGSTRFAITLASIWLGKLHQWALRNSKKFVGNRIINRIAVSGNKRLALAMYN